MNNDTILITHNLLDTGCVSGAVSGRGYPVQALATVLTNMAYFGYAPSEAALAELCTLDMAGLAKFWERVGPIFSNIKGTDRDMTSAMVYKNFPAEVLDMTQAQYWIRQIFIYIGVPADVVAEPAAPRAPLSESLALTMLAPAQPTSLDTIFANLVALPSNWTPAQLAMAVALHQNREAPQLAEFGFNLNGISLYAAANTALDSLVIENATDVLRLAAALSDQSPRLLPSTRFRNFSRSERKALLRLLNNTKNLASDMAARPTLWKKLMALLHPGDYSQFAHVSASYNALYRGSYKTFNSLIESLLKSKDVEALALLKTRPGEFLRRLHHVYSIFDMAAINTFITIVPKLTTLQLLKLQGYLRTINHRNAMVYPPKGNWARAQFVQSQLATPYKKVILEPALTLLKDALADTLRGQLASKLPEGVMVDPAVGNIKLPSNDQELAPYGRGTVLAIPDDITFVRTASYWHVGESHNVWYDNGWAFFDNNWKSLSGSRTACCWDHPAAPGAIFSGDPATSAAQGRGCQVIDLYLDQLEAAGVRYAVWNVLCYSNLAFSAALDVLATLQWGTVAQAGAVYEPSRAQMVFPLKGDKLASYVAYMDVKERKLVYLDLNLRASVHSAADNTEFLESAMPAIMGHLEALPSVADLFEHAPKGTMPVVYSDKDVVLQDGQSAYVFKPQNAENNFKPIDLSALLT